MLLLSVPKVALQFGDASMWAGLSFCLLRAYFGLSYIEGPCPERPLLP